LLFSLDAKELDIFKRNKIDLMTQQEVFIKMALDAWITYVKRTDDLFMALSDEQLLREVSPGRNRGIYLLGHLAGVHDRMLPVLGFGDQLYPELYGAFVESPDKAIADIPSIAALRLYWKEVNAKLAEQFNQLKPEDWFQRHNSVSEEDFKKEPHRNKLNLIINRTNHLASHFGQLVFLSNKEE
jgi:hypothetical protein